jgi:hypothetical protein
MPNWYLGCVLDPSVAQQLIKNYPGVAELAPSEAYWAASGSSGLVRGDGSSELPLTFVEGRATIASVMAATLNRNLDLITQADQWHASVDDWSPLDGSVRLLRMVGYDAADGAPACDPQALPCRAEQAGRQPAGTIGAVDVGANHALTMVSGDGTVPLLSASVYNPATKFDDRGAGHNMYWCAISHMGLAQSTAVWQAAEQFVEGAVDDSADTIAAGGGCTDGTSGSVARLGLGP